jgi:type VI secretion system protein ImpA
MKRVIDIDAVLAPIPGDNPAGDDLRYSPIYDEIKEARKTDDPLSLGDWKREVKTSDWDKVIAIALETLTKKTKDLQIAAWLLEALIMEEGFEGLAAGLRIFTGLLRDYWENAYPLVEEGDLEFRAAPLEFINEKVSTSIKQIPLTDRKVTPGYSLLKWQESREVGYERGTLNQHGDVDESRKTRRDECIAEGKLTAEEFDSAVTISPTAFYEVLANSLSICRGEFKKFDSIVDQQFGSQAPRLSDLGQALEDCEQFVMKTYNGRKDRKPIPADGGENNALSKKNREEEELEKSENMAASAISPVLTGELKDTGSFEKTLWEEAFQIMKSSGIKRALDRLLSACYSAPSVREKNRCRLLIAKLCLQADRPDLAKPIIEELQALIEELHLERWESPLWIAEVLNTLYQCLTRGEPPDEDSARARVIFQRLCTMDVTKAITYK